MSDPNTSPVSLPAGSFDATALQKSLDKAAKGSADNYDDAVRTAVDEANAGVNKVQDARTIPGYEFRDVENKDLGVTEKVQVFDPKLIDDKDSAGAIPEAETRNRQARTTAAAVEKADSPTKE